MKLKSWKDYSIEEKKALLNHWWHYYGKMLYSVEELNRFNELIDTRDEEVLNCAIFSYCRGLSSQLLLTAMREDKVEELFSALPETHTKDELYNRAYEALSCEFLDVIVGSYNDPEPDIPMGTDEIIRQVL